MAAKALLSGVWGAYHWRHMRVGNNRDAASNTDESCSEEVTLF